MVYDSEKAVGRGEPELGLGWIRRGSTCLLAKRYFKGAPDFDSATPRVTEISEQGVPDEVATAKTPGNEPSLFPPSEISERFTGEPFQV